MIRQDSWVVFCPGMFCQKTENFTFCCRKLLVEKNLHKYQQEKLSHFSFYTIRQMKKCSFIPHLFLLKVEKLKSHPFLWQNFTPITKYDGKMYVIPTVHWHPEKHPIFVKMNESAFLENLNKEDPPIFYALLSKHCNLVTLIKVKTLLILRKIKPQTYISVKSTLIF